MTMLKKSRRSEVQINNRDLHIENLSQNYISIKHASFQKVKHLKKELFC